MVSDDQCWKTSLKENLPLRHDALLFSTSGTGSFICPVIQTCLDIPRSLITQSMTTWRRRRSRWLVFRCETDANRRPVNPQSDTLTIAPPRPPILYISRSKPPSSWGPNHCYCPSVQVWPCKPLPPHPGLAWHDVTWRDVKWRDVMLSTRGWHLILIQIWHRILHVPNKDTRYSNNTTTSNISGKPL